MESGRFQYDPDQWEKIAKRVEAAGGAKEKLNDRRPTLEERVAQYKDRIERWTGVGYDGVDLRPRYQKIAKASADLKAAVSEVNFIEDSEWWGWLTDAPAREGGRTSSGPSTTSIARRRAERK